MVAAPLVWAVHFVSVYAATSVICAKSGATGDARAIIVGLGILAISVIAFIGWRAWLQRDLDPDDPVVDQATDDHRRAFLGHVGLLLAAISAIGVTYVSLPAIFIGTCQ
jgi:uncharacterized iron-regulated membrane protein